MAELEAGAQGLLEIVRAVGERVATDAMKTGDLIVPGGLVERCLVAVAESERWLAEA